MILPILAKIWRICLVLVVTGLKNIPYGILIMILLGVYVLFYRLKDIAIKKKLSKK